ncbi:A/G-specific adenine glycosylase [Haloferula luteola]|uniref:Adenine DNA glycosylase n=1 Tax=Haloferula luteola TaxID=595692 RepID=A0A840UYP4_9BACT|nr:A/G-specific adenine glycosylase [Haloferula luteola]MBB5350902.1 A/G-specific adenine glycosylase [Haloferula luteola]
MPALDDPEGFRVALGDWFERHGRDYPWRRTQDPYAILVSEVMLQQTQIGTVLGKGFYGRFMERFPTVESLAGAGDEDLLKAWEGLGYYRRARFLREAARAVVSRHGGRFPESHEELLALPGVGKYTAGAVVSFAYNRKATVVDGNVARVLSRIVNFFGAVDGPGLREIWEWAGELVDPRKPRIFNSALMELGQTLCRPGVPDCLECPVAKWCVTREPERLPVKAKKVVTTAVTEHLVFFQRQGRLLMKQPSDGRRVDMWRLPEFPEAEAWPELGRWKYGITRYRVTMVVHRPPDDWVGVPGAIWMPCEELEDRVLPPVDRKAILKLLEGG